LEAYWALIRLASASASPETVGSWYRERAQLLLKTNKPSRKIKKKKTKNININKHKQNKKQNKTRINNQTNKQTHTNKQNKQNNTKPNPKHKQTNKQYLFLLISFFSFP